MKLEINNPVNDQLFFVPVYPDKTPLSLSHKPLIDEYNARQPRQLSHTNFTNLFMLDIENDTFISRVDENIVITQQELGSDNKYYLVLLKEVTEAELQKIFDAGIEVISLFPYEMFNARPDLDNSDYVYDIHKTATLIGGEYTSMRRKVNSFDKKHTSELRVITSDEYDMLWEFAVTILDKALQKTPKQLESLQMEKAALEKTLNFAPMLDVKIDGLLVNDELVAFTVSELLPVASNRQRAERDTDIQQGETISTLLLHLFRTNNSYVGIGEYLFRSIAERYQSDADSINFEQDLGIEGLRQFKGSLKPKSLNTVYTVTKLT